VDGGSGQQEGRLMTGRTGTGAGPRRQARSPLALRRIDGNMAFISGGAWAWFWVPTERWAFRPDGERSNLVVDLASRVAALAGRQLHLRITSRPYPAAAWARALDTRTPEPLDATTGLAWADHLVRAQRHVRAATMADKEIYLGADTRAGRAGRGVASCSPVGRGTGAAS
jgi:hypothetical protein